MGTTSGATCERFSVVTAMSLNLSSLAKPWSDGYAEITSETWFETAAGTDCPVPLNGTCRTSMPSVDFTDSMTSCMMLPTPEDPYEYLPGLAFGSATNWGNVAAGIDGWSARKSGARAMSDTKVKSFSAYVRERYMNGLMLKVAMSVAISVYPSAGRAITYCAATTPLPPGRLSITTGWPHLSESFCPTTRAMVSGSPPGAYGTTSVTALLGYAAGLDHALAAMAAYATAARMKRHVMKTSSSRFPAISRERCCCGPRSGPRGSTPRSRVACASRSKVPRDREAARPAAA